MTNLWVVFARLKNLIMDIDKLIEEKTECFTGNGDYYFTYVTPEDCKKIVEEALKQWQTLPIDNVNHCEECNGKGEYYHNTLKMKLDCPYCNENSCG